MLASPASRRDLGSLVRASMVMLFAGALYRFDTYLVAFSPGANWSYFPSVAEILITAGLVAGEVLAYIIDREDVPDHRRPAGEGRKDSLMSTHITVDPITRIEGHLRIDVEVDGGVVRKAWSSGQMFRGIERILQGRDPREAWLFTQRFCGVCTTVHAIASVRAVENALKLEIPPNAQYIRNLIVAAHAMHDHIVHFYQLSALDWVDVVSALKADVPKTAALAASISDWPGNSAKQLQAVKDRLAGFVAKGQLGIFTNGYWGHPAMKLAPEVNLLAVTHYLQALDYQRKANQVVTILGSKTPNIQNLAVGGVANAINLDNDSTLNMAKLFQVKDLLDEMKGFIEQVYFVDVCAIGAMYADWLKHGAGVMNYLAVPDLPTDTKGTAVRSARRHDLQRRSRRASRRSRPSRIRTSRRTSRSRSRTRGTTATGRGIRTKKTPCRSTPRTRPTRSTPGSSRRASTATSCRSARSRRCSSASRRGTRRRSAGPSRRSRPPARSPAPSSRRPCSTRRSAATPRA